MLFSFIHILYVCFFVFTADLSGLNFFIDYRYSNFLKSIHMAYVWTLKSAAAGFDYSFSIFYESSTQCR